MCNYRGRLWGLMSTPSALGLHYNKRIFRENADALRAAGCDPNRAPQTIEELDRYAQALDAYDPNNPRRVVRAGFLPLEPNWYINYYPYFFGGDYYDAASDRITFDSDPRVLRCLEWMQGYAKRLRAEALGEQFSNLSTGFASTQNPFFAGRITMTIQGPWMANFAQIYRPDTCEVIAPKVLEPFLPRVLRVHNYDYGVAPFPCEVPPGPRPAYCGGDVLVIPRGARHRREAFEFIAFVNRQDVMERLCAAQTKGSPLSKVSPGFLRAHPNPYMHVFEQVAASPIAKGPQQVAIFPEMTEQVNYVTQRLMALDGTPEELLRESQQRLDERYARHKDRERARAGR
jgi:multiple sugar transport system substrate-binding protein